MLSEAQKKAQAKYDKANTVQFKMKFSKKNDAEIIERIQAQPNKQDYIRQLVIADINHTKNHTNKLNADK